MGIAKLYSQSGSGGKINGIIEDYYAYAGENISAGDFVEFINGVASKENLSGNLATLAKGSVMSATKIDSKRVLVMHNGTDSYYLYAIVCQIEGMTITVGTNTRIAQATYGHVNPSRPIYVGNNTVFVAYDMSYEKHYQLYGIVLTINGTVIGYGSSYQLSNVYYTSSSIDTVLLENGNVFVAHSYDSSYKLYGMVCTISGTTIGHGTDTALSTTSNTSGAISVGHLSSNRVFVAHEFNSGGYLNGLVCTVSGTTITIKITDVSIINESYAGSKISLEVLDETKVFIAHCYDTNYYQLHGVVCTISDTAIARGAAFRLSSSKYSGTYVITSALIGENKVLVNYASDSTNYYLYGVIASISGLVITAGTDTQLSDTKWSAYNNRLATVSSSTGIAIVIYYLGSEFVAQAFGVDEEKNIPATTISVAEYETQVRKATTSDIYGVAKTSGMGAYKTIEYTIPDGESVSTGENREYSVETLVEGDIIPKTWTGSGNRYTSNDGTELTSSDNSGTSNEVNNVCDGISGDYYWKDGYSVTPWVKLKFPNGVKITKMKIFAQDYRNAFLSAKVQGSNDDGLWVDLYNFTNTEISYTAKWVEITLNNTDYYKNYRLYFEYPTNTSSGTEIRISEWQTTEYVGLVPYTGVALQSGTAGDTIQIAVPVTDEESTGHKDMIRVYQPYPEKRLVMADGNILTTSNGDVFLLKEAI